MDANKIKTLSKVLAENSEKQPTKVMYATVVSSDSNGVVVQLDGSDVQIPVSATIEVNTNDRVMVQINKHEAVVVGNVSDKSITRTTADGLINVFAHNGTFTGMLKIGGSAQNQYGVLELYDENDNLVSVMDNEGSKWYDTDGITLVGSMGSGGFKLKGSSQWDYDWRINSNHYGTCHFSYGLSASEDVDTQARNLPCLSISNDRSGTYQSQSEMFIIPTGQYTTMQSVKPMLLKCIQTGVSQGGNTYDYVSLLDVDLTGKLTMYSDCENTTSNASSDAKIEITNSQETPKINLYAYKADSQGVITSGTEITITDAKMTIDNSIVINENAKSIYGVTTGYDEVPLLTVSGSDNIVIGRTGNRNEYGDINLYAGTAQNSRIRLDSGNVLTTGTLTTGGTITSAGGLYTNGKTAVDDGTAGAAITTTGTIQLSASGTPYVYYRYANSTSYYTRLAASNVTANRTLTMPNSTGTLAISSSDIRVKENVKDSDVKALELINKIKLHEFDWKEEGRGGAPHWRCGIIADELEELDIELTSGGGYNDDGSINVKSIDTLYLEGYIVKAIQEILERLQRLEAEHEHC